MTQTTETIFLTADTVNGVQEGNDESVLTEDVISEEAFFGCLSTCSDDECIGAYVSLDTYKKIKKAYGIGGYVTTVIEDDDEE